MRTPQLAFASALLLSTTLAFARSNRGRNADPCAVYKAACKEDNSVTSADDPIVRRVALQNCVKKAAASDIANGQACTTALGNRKAN